jgi:hypothetical protein
MQPLQHLCVNGPMLSSSVSPRSPSVDLHYGEAGDIGDPDGRKVAVHRASASRIAQAYSEPTLRSLPICLPNSPAALPSNS